MDVKNSKIIKKMERAYVNRYIIEYNNLSFNKLYSLHDKLNDKLKSDTIIIQTNEDIIKDKQIKNNSNISIHLKKKAIKYIIDNKDILFVQTKGIS